MPDPKVQGEKQYGEVKAQEELRQANPLPKAQVKPINPKQMVQQAAPVPQTASTYATNPYMRLPAEVWQQQLPNLRKKTQFQKTNDVGLLWEVLAATSTDPLTKRIAESMRGGGNASR